MSTCTATHTASGSNRLAVAFVANSTGGTLATVSSVTYDGVAMTQKWSTAYGCCYRISAYYLVAPATTTNANVTATLSDADDELGVCVMTFTNVDQTTPLDSPASPTTSGSSTTPSITATAGSTDLTVDFVYMDDGGSASTITAGGGQTKRCEIQNIGGFTDLASSHEQAANPTMSWTWSASGTWGIGYVVLNEVSGGGPTLKIYWGD